MTTLAQIFDFWEAVLDRLGRRSVSHKGTPLTDRDRRTFTEALVMTALILTDLSSRYGGIGSQRDIAKWCFDMTTIDVADLGSLLSDAITALRNVHEPRSYNSFKRELAKQYPCVGRLFAPIRGALAAFLADPEPRGFYVCYQFFSFLTHLSLVDIDADISDEYVELEHQLSKTSLPSFAYREMNEIMKEWVGDLRICDPDDFHPCFGPGAIAEPRDVVPLELRHKGKLTSVEKYRNLGSDYLLDQTFLDQLGVLPDEYMPLPRNWYVLANSSKCRKA